MGLCFAIHCRMGVDQIRRTASELHVDAAADRRVVPGRGGEVSPIPASVRGGKLTSGQGHVRQGSERNPNLGVLGWLSVRKQFHGSMWVAL